MFAAALSGGKTNKMLHFYKKQYYHLP